VAILQLVVLVVAPILVVGVINRVKARWAGRRGPGLWQWWFDQVRLLRKTPVYSRDTSWIFPVAPYLVLATTLVAGLIAPLAPGVSSIGFSGDLIAFTYLFGFGRVLLILSAIDTASSFEGMGASREAAYSALLEPALLLAVGTLAFVNDVTSLRDLVSLGTPGAFDVSVRVAIVFALFVVLLVESSRVPADDPTTHLELTMVHEVMVLDHSGPELAALQYAGGMKMTVFALVIAAVLNPVAGSDGLSMAVSIAVSLVLVGGIAVAVGLVESLTARLRFRAIPTLILAAFVGVGIALTAVIARQGGLE
jgi:formate hydrogenlyase subunit 4